jgi:hypothetical protein
MSIIKIFSERERFQDDVFYRVKDHINRKFIGLKTGYQSNPPYLEVYTRLCMYVCVCVCVCVRVCA